MICISTTSCMTRLPAGQFSIDFDTRHDFRLSPTQRHGDDLKVMLLELIGLSDEQWRQRGDRPY